MCDSISGMPSLEEIAKSLKIDVDMEVLKEEFDHAVVEELLFLMGADLQFDDFSDMVQRKP